MNKAKAIELLGGTPKKAAEAMGYTSPHAVYMWPDVLPQSTADRVAGVVARIANSEQNQPPALAINGETATQIAA